MATVKLAAVQHLILNLSQCIEHKVTVSCVCRQLWTLYWKRTQGFLNTGATVFFNTKATALLQRQQVFTCLALPLTQPSGHPSGVHTCAGVSAPVGTISSLFLSWGGQLSRAPQACSSVSTLDSSSPHHPPRCLVDDWVRTQKSGSESKLHPSPLSSCLLTDTSLLSLCSMLGPMLGVGNIRETRPLIVGSVCSVNTQAHQSVRQM